MDSADRTVIVVRASGSANSPLQSHSLHQGMRWNRPDMKCCPLLIGLLFWREIPLLFRSDRDNFSHLGLR